MISLAVALTAAVVGRTIDQLAARLTRSAARLFQAATGILPELLIGTLTLQHGLCGVVLATIVGAALNMLLCGTGLAYIAGGLWHRSRRIDIESTQNTTVLPVLVVFVILDGEVNHLEGVMLLGLYVVLGSLFWWS